MVFTSVVREQRWRGRSEGDLQATVGSRIAKVADFAALGPNNPSQSCLVQHQHQARAVWAWPKNSDARESNRLVFPPELPIHGVAFRLDTIAEELDEGFIHDAPGALADAARETVDDREQRLRVGFTVAFVV